MKNIPKIIVILGQTSTGKSDFAVDIAKETHAEIISADSRQVYKGMDLGAGKITKKEMRGIPHYLLDVISPKKVFSVNDFKKLADKKIEEIIDHNNIPIICGGTGFYIDTLINGSIYPEVPPNNKLRKELSSFPLLALCELLGKLDPERIKTIDKNNKIRLIRAIEIAKTLGSVPKIVERNLSCCTTSKSSQRLDTGSDSFQVLKIGLTIPDELLKERIRTRLISRIKKGMIKEVENLHKKGISWKRMDALGLEYRYVSFYLQEKLTKEEMIEKLYTEIWHFAKRQKTWFKRDKEIIWINPLKKSDKLKALREVKKFLK